MPVTKSLSFDSTLISTTAHSSSLLTILISMTFMIRLAKALSTVKAVVMITTIIAYKNWIGKQVPYSFLSKYLWHKNVLSDFFGLNGRTSRRDTCYWSPFLCFYFCFTNRSRHIAWRSLSTLDSIGFINLYFEVLKGLMRGITSSRSSFGPLS